MAYLEFRSEGLVAATEAAPRGERSANFTTLEWTVIRLAQGDPVSSVRRPGKMLAMLRSVFGFKQRTVLANEKLEALRRIAVLALRRGVEVASADLPMFMNAGYSPQHFQLLLACVCGAPFAGLRSGRGASLGLCWTAP